MPHHAEGLPEAEVAALEKQAGAGDAEAAWKLSTNYAFYEHNEEQEKKWLTTAAHLKHPQAERWVAYLIKEGKRDYKDFGPSPQQAVLSLNTSAAQKISSACEELAAAYAEGYFGPPDYAKAREYYQRGAEFADRSCWLTLARYCADGIGGPTDLPQAYYWLSLAALCVHPESMTGEEVWALREKVAAQMTPAQMKQQLLKADNYIARVQVGRIVLDSPRFGEGTGNPEYVEEGRRLSFQWEANHRKKWLK